jgi:predicted nucleic acid-binding protein
MTGGIVLDASAALKLVLAEPLSDQAEALFRATVSAGQPVYGPSTLFSEALSALYKRTRYSNPATAISLDQAEHALTELLDLGIDQIAPVELYAATLAFASAHGLTRTYDTFYVVLAQLLGVELWTDDQNLINALADKAPWVRWIGDYPLI